MAKLGVFNFLTLNGFYKGLDKDISWHTHGGGEETKFSEQGANSGGIILFGRVTYQMMVAFWPTPAAAQNYPVVAEGMNKAEKIVFSTTLKKAEWNNCRVVADDMPGEVRRLKETGTKDMTILGSGNVVGQLAEHNLIDQYQFMIDPVAIGVGTPIFQNINRKLELKLTASRVFDSGIVLLIYVPAAN